MSHGEAEHGAPEYSRTDTESRARLPRFTITSPLRISLWMAPSSPMMMPDSGETL